MEQENNILLLLPISTNVNETKSRLKQAKRKEQYIEGIKRLLEYPRLNEFDIVLIDNTTSEKDKDIEAILPSISEYITIQKNILGASNPGCGILDVWHFLKKDIESYDWIIHYEPRQYMKDFRIFDMFLEEKKNIFLYGDLNKNHYYTGLFTLTTKSLLKYLVQVDANKLHKKGIGLEYSIFEYIKEDIYIVNELGIRWHDRIKDQYIDL